MLRNNTIDETNDDFDQENLAEKNGSQLHWYLIDSEGTFCFIWNFFITLLIIYTLIVAPFM